MVLTVTLPPDQESLGLPNSNFLVGHLPQDTEASAQTYYDTLDPGPFPTPATSAARRAIDTANARFVRAYNAGDVAEIREADDIRRLADSWG